MKRSAIVRPAALAVLALTASCKRPSGRSETPSAAAAAPQAPGAPVIGGVVLDVTHDLDECTFGHRGVLLDFGDPSMRASLRPGGVARLLARAPDEEVEHEGATWLRVRSRSLAATFYWPAMASSTSEANVYVEARIRGGTAHSVGLTVDGKLVGAWSLGKGDTRVMVARAATPVTLAPGGHELSLRFVGGARSGAEPLADIDWVHIGTGEPGEPYSAPTRADAIVDAMVGDRSERAVSLRAPGFVRCSAWIPANATLEVSLATAGGSDADVEALLVRDRRAPIVLGTAHVVGDAPAWVPWSVPVAGIEGAGALASIELVVLRADTGTRVLLGGLRVIASPESSTAEPAAARSLVLVVSGSTSARALAPWGGPHLAPELTREASAGTAFEANRASSSLANSVVASMLTGLPPLLHGLDDAEARLPDAPVMVQEACRQGGIATAMFTANPTTGATFGFARGWDTFVEQDPLEDAPATRVFDDAAAWVEAHKATRFFVVVHARGGHPPWDASPEELRAMPPESYLGVLEPRRAAEALAKVRAHPARFKDDDRVRAWALYDRAIDAHDEALGRLLTAIRNAGRDGDTAIVVTSDVAANEALPVPFVDTDVLDEPLLATPLVIRWPGVGALAGRRVPAPSSPVDLARTMLGALGLAPPAAYQGVDLAALAQGAIVPASRPLVATRGSRFSIRWGPYVLVGVHERETRVCDLSLDPACIADIRATSPLALEVMQRFAVDVLGTRATARPPRVPLVLDPHTKAELVRWGGRLADERDATRDAGTP